MDAECRHGGHVVNFPLLNRELHFCYSDDFQIGLPDKSVFGGLDLKWNWSKELKRAEAER